MLALLAIFAVLGSAHAAPQAAASTSTSEPSASSAAVDTPLSSITPSSLQFTYYFANAACAGPNMTQVIVPNRCTFIEFNDGQGALSYAPFVRGNDFACSKSCHLETWNAESCSGSPDNIIRAEDASQFDCQPIIRGKSVMLVC